MYNSPYAFAENRVIDGRELEGLEWVKSTTNNQDGTKHTAFTVKMKVHNKVGLSESEVLTTSFAIGAQIEETFQGTDSDGNTYSTSVEFDFDSEVDLDNDFYIEYTDVVLDENGNPMMFEDLVVGKVDEIGNTEKNKIQVKTHESGTNEGRSEKSIARTGAHEVGHTGGLTHASGNGDQNNIITQNSTGTEVTGDQLTTIDEKVKEQ